MQAREPSCRDRAACVPRGRHGLGPAGVLSARISSGPRGSAQDPETCREAGPRPQPSSRAPSLPGSLRDRAASVPDASLPPFQPVDRGANQRTACEGTFGCFPLGRLELCLSRLRWLRNTCEGASWLFLPEELGLHRPAASWQLLCMRCSKAGGETSGSAAAPEGGGVDRAGGPAPGLSLKRWFRLRARMRGLQCWGPHAPCRQVATSPGLWGLSVLHVRALHPPVTQSPSHLFLRPCPQANINGRVLAQCNIDELKKEMNMNFGDWHLFRSTVRYSTFTAPHQPVPGSAVWSRLAHLWLLRKQEKCVGPICPPAVPLGGHSARHCRRPGRGPPFLPPPLGLPLVRPRKPQAVASGWSWSPWSPSERPVSLQCVIALAHSLRTPSVPQPPARLPRPGPRPAASAEPRALLLSQMFPTR